MGINSGFKGLICGGEDFGAEQPSVKELYQMYKKFLIERTNTMRLCSRIYYSSVS